MTDYEKRKGRRVIVSLAQTWELQIFIIPAGTCILDSNCYSAASSMIFMQCTNANKSSVGHLCVGRFGTREVLHGSHQSGLVADCFLCVQLAVFVKDNQTYVAYHGPLPRSNILMALHDVMHHCDYDQVKFVNHAFNPVCIVNVRLQR